MDLSQAPTVATKGKEAEHTVPRQVAVLPSPGQPISRLRFNAEGTQILAARCDGTSAAVWALSPDVNRKLAVLMIQLSS